MKWYSLFAAFLLTACTQTGFAVLNFPSGKGVTVERDVAFGPDKGQGLDIYLPPKPWAKKPEIVVFYYGGRWEQGRRQDYKFIGDAFAQRGYITVIPDYRKYPEVKFPAFVEDAAKSLAWVYHHIGEYGGNRERIHLSGHSAGAHIASLLAADSRYLEKERLDADKIIYDFAGLAGPYAFTPEEEDLKDMFGPPQNYPQMQAPSFINGHEPPMFLLHGAEDKTVGLFNMDKLSAAIAAQKGCVKTKIYPGLSHISILTNASSLLGDNGKPVFDDMAAFFKAGRSVKCQPIKE